MQIINNEVNIKTEYLNLTFYGDIEPSELNKLLQLKNLKHLNLSSSDLKDKHLALVGKLNNLELLDLDLTEITDKGLQSLKALSNLKELRLKDNPQLTDDCIKYIAEIEQLELIHIGNTSITITGLKNLLSQKELKSIILDAEFNDKIKELLALTNLYPKLEITLKGTGILSKGNLK